MFRWVPLPHTCCRLSILAVLAGPLSLPIPLLGQTDFYNLDREHPLRVEDAYTTARWAFEIQASPFSLSQDRSGTVRFAPSLELKHGLLPGLEVSVGTGIENLRQEPESSTRFQDVELSALLNLWVEGTALPAAGIRITSHLPTESGRSAVAEVRGALTRTLVGPVRVHLNGAAVIGDGREEDGWAGAAADYVLPFHHTLLLAETWVSFTALGDEVVHSSIGARFQATPTLLIDAGIGRGWTGDEREDWVITLGMTHEFGVRAVIPGGD